jgi:hypothetical protein
MLDHQDPPSPSDIPAPRPPATAIPPLAFKDAEGAKRWARELPLGNFAAAGRTVLAQLQAMSTAELPPRERAAIAEVMRDQVAYLHTELARRYAGRPQPAEAREQESGDQAIELWQALWGQYSACLQPLLDGAPELAGVKPKLLQRGLFVGKQLVLVHGLARRVPPPAVWHELHAYYRLAEMLECAVTAVSDNLIHDAVGISCYSTYAHALLLGLADPCAMSVKQIELVDRWLAMWARKLFPYAQQRETEGPVIVVDLDGSAGALLTPTAPRNPSAATRFGYPGKLATSVRGRLKRLQSGANPAELQLGHDCSADQCTTLLGHLDARWYQVPRHAASLESRSVELCAGGLPAAYFRVGGRTFERQDASGHMSFDEAQRLQALNVVASREAGKEGAERTWAWERWSGSCEPREALLVRAGEAWHRWQLDQLAVVRDEGKVRAAFVTRVALDAEGGLSVALRLWSSAPRAVTLRPLSTTTTGEAPLPALLLAETPDDKACLVLPPRSFNPSRVLCSIEGMATRRFRLTRLLQRGVDFERVAFEETA